MNTRTISPKVYFLVQLSIIIRTGPLPSSMKTVKGVINSNNLYHAFKNGKDDIRVTFVFHAE